MKHYIQHYPSPRRRDYRHAAVIVSMWLASAAMMAFIITQLFNIAS